LLRRRPVGRGSLPGHRDPSEAATLSRPRRPV